MAVSATSYKQSFDAHGYAFRLSGNCQEAIEGIIEDFAFFARAESFANSPVDCTLELNLGVPNYESVPLVDASIYTPRNVVYRHGADRFLDFGGRGLGEFNAARRSFRMTSESPHLVYEAAYHFLLSQIGQASDRQGLHRLHALALSFRDRAILVLLPMGGGKSTLGNALLQHQEITILSDDSPFIDRHGNSLAYPLRIGLLQGSESSIPPEHRRKIERMEFGPKFLVNYSYFAHRVVSSAKPGLVLLGRRSMAPQGRFEPAPYLTTLKGMIPNMVVGLGLFQGLEYLLDHSSLELASKLGLAASRLRNAHALTSNSKNFVFHMGRNSDANARMVLDLAERWLH